MKVSTSITLERETFEKLKEMAKREERSVSYILNRLIRDALRQAAEKPPPEGGPSIGFHSPQDCSRGGCTKCQTIAAHVRDALPSVLAALIGSNGFGRLA